jgi:hypothetical protein
MVVAEPDTFSGPQAARQPPKGLVESERPADADHLLARQALMSKPR